MYRPEQKLFAFRARRIEDRIRFEGTSYRYTAIALIALAKQPVSDRERILSGHDLSDVYARVVSDLEQMEDLGEIALMLWAGRVLGHPQTEKVLERLRLLQPIQRPCPTVETAWILSALTVPANGSTDRKLADAIAERLLGSFNPLSCLFSHWTTEKRVSWLRSHVCCFADMVYPIQALSHYYGLTGNSEAIDAARSCAQRMCQLQGPEGQWWWHFDVRTGRVIERYPVYAVHQDSMAPMALQTLKVATGKDGCEAIKRGLLWLDHAPEIDGSLIDSQQDLIWRKVARRESHKLVRGIQAGMSLLHPLLRAPGLDGLFPPKVVDHECRPYHMAWILYTWPTESFSESDGL